CLRLAAFFEVYAGLVEQRQVQADDLAVGLVEIIEHAPSMQPAAAATQNHDGQFRGVVAAGQHARTVQDHRVVEGRALPCLNAVQLSGNVRELFDKELVDLEPVGRVGM